jgi:hypothetical protein
MGALGAISNREGSGVTPAKAVLAQEVLKPPVPVDREEPAATAALGVAVSEARRSASLSRASHLNDKERLW